MSSHGKKPKRHYRKLPRAPHGTLANNPKVGKLDQQEQQHFEFHFTIGDNKNEAAALMRAYERLQKDGNLNAVLKHCRALTYYKQGTWYTVCTGCGWRAHNHELEDAFARLIAHIDSERLTTLSLVDMRAPDWRPHTHQPETAPPGTTIQ